MRTALVYPPQGEPAYPPLGIPSLQAYLKSSGFTDIVVRDLNIESYDFFLSEDFLFEQARQLEWRLSKLESSRKLKTEQVREYNYISRESLSSEYAVKNIEIAKRSIREMGAEMNLERYQWAFRVVISALRLISASFFPTELALKSFRMKYSAESWKQVSAAITDRRSNPYFAFFKEHAIPSLLKSKPDVIGISVNWPSQLIPALTLCRLIKLKSPGIHICLGGNLITHLSGALQKNPEFFRYADSCIRFEGETAFRNLLEKIEKRGDLAEAPNIIFLKDKQVFMSERTTFEEVKKLPPPDFAGMPLDLYFSPELILPVSASRGCYWRKCAFCSHHFAYQRYRTRKAEHVFRDMLTLAEKHQTRNFYFMDDCPSPAALKKTAAKIIEKGRNFRWGAEVRFETYFSPAVCRLLAQSGCKLVMFGMESASQRILDVMKKGIKKENMQEVIDNFHKAGVNVWLLFFLGFPGERPEEAAETLDFIHLNRDKIAAAGSGTFVLTRHSDVHEHPNDYNVSITSPDREKDMALSYDFESEETIPQESARKMIDEFFSNKGKEFQNITMIEAHGLFMSLSDFKKGYLLKCRRDGSADLDENWMNKPVEISPSVKYRVFRYNPYDKKAERKGTVHESSTGLIYDGEFDQVSEISPEVVGLLDLIDGKKTARRIAEQVAGPVDNERKGALEALSNLFKFRYII